MTILFHSQIPRVVFIIIPPREKIVNPERQIAVYRRLYREGQDPPLQNNTHTN
jgi:hypothetical protein